MLYQGPNGKTLVSEEYNQMCIDNQCECTVQAFPNPGDPYRAMRMLTFRNFSDCVVKVYQYDDEQQVHSIPAHGSIQVLLGSNEPLPTLEKVE
jgi:hypothetical protein